LSPDKYKVLRAFLNHNDSVKPTQIAKEMGKKFPSVMMHILGLTKIGYLVSTKKGYYKITNKGKNYLGLSMITKEFARELLTGKFKNKVFNFYLDLNQPINLQADNLQSFVSALKTVSVESVEFHMRRADFRKWIFGLGDLELADKIELLEKSDFVGESLRKKLHVTVFNRCVELAKIAGYNVVRK
jgi:hypothetical protein